MHSSQYLCVEWAEFLVTKGTENWSEERPISLQEKQVLKNIFKKAGAECHQGVVKPGTWRSVGQCFLKENHFLPRIPLQRPQREKSTRKESNTLPHSVRFFKALPSLSKKAAKDVLSPK